METEWAKSAWLWLGNETAAFGLRWLVVAVAMVGISGFIGWRYRELKREIAALRGSASPVTVNVLPERPHPQGSALIDPTAQPRSPDAPEARLRALELQIEAFASGQRNDHAGIWELHIALGEIGIAWPGPGVTPEFRRLVSAELLAACQQGDLETARASWARALD